MPEPDILRAGRLGVAELFLARARAHPTAPALLAEGRCLSFAALAARVERLAAGLAARGVARGDRIAILSENRGEYVEVMLASARIGAILACQNWRLAAPELAHCLRLVGPVLTIVSPRHQAALAALDPPAGGTVLVLGTAYEALIEAAPAHPPPVPFDPEDGMLILYTSGTTGLPKGALISQRAELARLAAFRPELRLSGAAREARDFLARGVSLGPVARLVYPVIVRAALALVGPPERRLLGAPRPSWRDGAALRVARLVAATVRVALTPAAPQVVESPPSTAST